MKTIIQKNYYQKKVWDYALLQRELHNTPTCGLPGSESELEKRCQERYEELRSILEAKDSSVFEFPSVIGKLKFKIATSFAVKVARHFELDVLVKTSEELGIVELSGNDIMCDTLWNDGKHKRRLLLLFYFANGVCVRDIANAGGSCIHIWLSYCLTRRIDWKKWNRV